MPTPHNDLDIQTLLAAESAARIGLVRAQPDVKAALEALVEESEAISQSSAGKAVPGTVAVAAVVEALAAPAEHGSVARAFRAVSHAKATAGDFVGALAAASQAGRHAEQAGDRVEHARATLAQMQPLLKTGRADEAREAGQQAIDQFTQAGERTLAARARVNVANVLKALGRGAEAVRLIDEALDVAGDQASFVVVAQNTRADAHLQLGEFEPARGAFHAALRATAPDVTTFPSAMVRSNLADLDARLGRAQAALDGYAVAAVAFEGLGAHSQVARVRVEEAELLAVLGAVGESAESFRNVMPELESRGLVFERARALSGLAMIARDQQPSNPDASAAAHEASVEGWRRAGNEYEFARARLKLAEVLAERGEVERAEGQVMAASGALTGSTIDELSVGAAQATLATSRGDRAAALSLLADAELAAASLHVAPAAAALAARAARLERESGNVDRAIAAARRAVAHVEQARASVNAERLRQSLLGSHVDAFEELVLALLARGHQGDTDAALEAVTRAKSRSLLERMVAGLAQPVHDAGGHTTPEAEARRRELLDRLNALYRSMSAGASTPGERDVAARANSRDIAAVERELDVLSVRDAASSGWQSLPAWSEARRSLEEGDLLVEYFVVDGGVRCFTATRDGNVVAQEMPISADAAALHVRRLQFQVRRSLRGSKDAADQIQAHLRDLGKALLAPIEATLRGARRILVAPHSVLHGLPMGALHVSQGETLLDLAPVAVLPSGAILPMLREPARCILPKNVAPRAVVIGVADAMAPAIEDEAREVADTLGVRPILGAEASVERVTEELQSADLAHIACHGLYLADAARSSGLQLADGWLTVRKILSLTRGPGTVVLSACETGRSHCAPGDEHLGLVRAFVDRGARTVLATLWSAQDVATRAMMVEFHKSRAITSLGTDAERVRHAQLNLRLTEPDPARWAPYFVTGGLQ